jgi:GLPGLI family protein
MKIIIFTIITFHISVMQAQIIDSAYIQALYKHSFTEDSLYLGKQFPDKMMLFIGTEYTKFFSYNKYIRDSLIRANPAEYARISTISSDGMRVSMPAKNELSPIFIIDELFVNRNTSKLVSVYASINTLQYTEQLMKPDWKIHANTCHILGYVCQKATANYKGRDWEAWFTTEIPINEGPWLLRGLPGLILKAEDKNKQFTYECIGIEALKDKRAISSGNYKAYKLVSKRDYLKVKKMIHEDPKQYISVMLGDKAPKFLNSGHPEVKRQYNPIEIVN